MPLTLDSLARVTARIADASLDPSAWPDAMETIAKAFDSTVSSLLVHDFHSGEISFSSINGSYDAAFGEYVEYYGAIDSMRQKAMGLGAGEIYNGRELAPPAGLERSEVYNDFYLKWGWGRLVGGYVLKNDNIGAVMTVQRPRSSRDYSEDEIAACRLIVPHLARAVQVQQKLASVSAGDRPFADAVERLAHAVIHLNSSGRILEMNAAAREMEASGAFHVSDHQLVALSPRDTAHLRRLIQSAVTPLAIENDCGTMMLTRGDESPPLHVVVTPARNQAHDGNGGAIVFITDPDRNPRSPMAILSATYGLTTAESRVAVALSQGRTVEAIAGEACVSLNTLKTHLKNIQMKMGTRRQAETVAKLLRGPLNSLVK